jgi:hypothetical protein
MGHVEKNEHKRTQDSASPKKNRRPKKISRASISDTKGKLKQPTVLDVLKKEL